jgi:methyl-accepting chemotaxis protein
MHVLSHLQLRTKLAVLMGLSALALVASIGVAASLLRQRMIDDRIDKLAAVVNATIGAASSLETQIAAHQLTREQAIEQFRNVVHALRFDGGTGYVTAWTSDGIVLAHGTAPTLENKPTPVADSSGRTVLQLGEAALRDGAQGVVSYAYPRPGQTQPKPKVAYVARFDPWQAVFMSGAYIDDLDAAFNAVLWDLATTGGVILLVSLAAAWLINRDIVGSLGRLKTAMDHLANGELATEVPGTERRDEVGGMAAAVLVFKEHMVREQHLAAEREQDREQAEAAKHAALVAMAETIETEAKRALEKVGRRTGAMAEAANGMSASAVRTGASAESAASAAAQALANAQTVASAAEQLTASIREIGGQVSQSVTVVGRAVEAGRVTRETIGALNEQVGRIGAVADMISEIAARTNLLALNATIEAARAGDAGKGFAVVASEVKQLATQTAKSTEEISRHIGEVRAATGASVAAVGRIEETIGEINAIAGSIAAAVEQQGAATAEIARNVTETAAAANEMTTRTHEVSDEAKTTGQRAADVLGNTTGLDSAVHDLHNAVIHLVRTSTSEVDRRRYRRRPCHVEATLLCQGHSEAASLHDLSERGCHVGTALAYQAGQRVQIALTRFGIRLEGTVAEKSEGGMHITFLGDGLPADQADRISLTTIGELVRLAKDDHVGFVKRVADAVAGGQKLPPESLSSPHHCRFGVWYDDVSDAAAMSLPSFKAIKAPHAAVHELGRKALVALGVDDAAAAQRCAAEMRNQSEHVLRCLDEFGRDYPKTFAKAAA